MTIRVTLAGCIGMEVCGVEVAEDVLRRPGRPALAYLVSERCRPVPRHELAKVLWGDKLPRSSEQLLRGIVSKLRTCLRAAGLEPTTALTGAFGAYQMHLPPHATVDVEGAVIPSTKPWPPRTRAGRPSSRRGRRGCRPGVPARGHRALGGAPAGRAASPAAAGAGGPGPSGARPEPVGTCCGRG